MHDRYFIEVFGRIALAIPDYRFTMSVRPSVNILVKFQVEAKSRNLIELQTWNFAWR